MNEHEIEARLQETAQLLRESPALGPDARAALADLVQELADSLRSGEIPPEAAAHLAGTTARLATAVHEQHEPEHVGQARTGLEDAVLATEVHAPAAADLARRIMAALASIGI